MTKFLIIATFKSNKTKSEIEAWLTKVQKSAHGIEATLAVAPSLPYLSLALSKGSKLELASQNVSPYPQGAYTGEVNAEQLSDLGVKYCLVGHSERRRYFHETNATVASKVELLLDQGITPLVCLRDQDIIPQLAAIDKALLPRIICCYEEEGNIGAFEATSNDLITQAFAKIRREAGDVPLIYGGSVSAKNLPSLLETGLDGVLVSSASLDPSDFIDLLNSYQRAKG